MDYKGYLIVRANGRGGKAGRECNKTSTIQVQEPFNATTVLLLKQFRFTVGSTTSEAIAALKAKEFIDKLPPRDVKVLPLMKDRGN